MRIADEQESTMTVQQTPTWLLGLVDTIKTDIFSTLDYTILYRILTDRISDFDTDFSFCDDIKCGAEIFE